MEKNLRNKFVFITMTLMTIVFGALFIINLRYTQHGENIETYRLLNWLATDEDFYVFAEIDEKKVDLEGANPIYFIMLDQNGNIMKTVNESFLDEERNLSELIQEMYQSPEDEWMCERYIFVRRHFEDGRVGIYFTSTTNPNKSIRKTVQSIGLFMLGFLLLLAVSFYLSRFVVEPAKRMLEREKEFISDASHELKTPLAAINVNAQALLGEMEDNKHIHYILGETERMNRLIQKLLTLSYLKEQKDSIPKKLFSISECCEEMVLTLESLAFEKNIDFEYDIAEDVEYYGNSDEIKQVVSILLDNALKHTYEKGQIRFQMKRRKHHIVITVFNTGRGISEKDIPHIFERFYCAETTRTEKRSSFGLGLSIAKAIVDAHDGEIEVKSHYGKDVQFTVTL
ncbi:MAG: HAMP domain-containing histidine kinase [Lachnospiraceae bacterium]|nr:HAMP domain-containing histidine kinase [Lachnospiraceae bacterium]